MNQASAGSNLGTVSLLEWQVVELETEQMQLEDYFEFLSPEDIRIKGHRIGIDNVLDYYLQGYTPEQILEHYPSLNLEKIHATITYYWHNQAAIDAYMKQLNIWREQRYQEWAANPPAQVQRLKTLRDQRAREQRNIQ